MDRNELKIQALLEKISNLTANYENQVADYRVEITFLTQRVEELEKQQEGDGETSVEVEPEADSAE
jgi:hypothetical protein